MITNYDKKRLTPKQAAAEMVKAIGDQFYGSSVDEMADAACIERPTGIDQTRVWAWVKRAKVNVTFHRKQPITHNKNA